MQNGDERSVKVAKKFQEQFTYKKRHRCCEFKLHKGHLPFHCHLMMTFHIFPLTDPPMTHFIIE